MQEVISKSSVTHIFEPENLATTVPKHGDCKIDVSIGIKITGLHVGHTTDVVKQHLTDVAGAHAPMKLNPTHRRVGGQDVTENRHDTVEVAITVDVDKRRMSRHAHVGNQSRFPPLAVIRSIKANNTVVEGITGDDFRHAI